ncbi:hypothetical protein Leryth_013135 [Lithospermum erythrorhizon]|nr:hypothetical protein Leryth_013135 [Lithospermum erythrorhizon]
MEDCVPNRLGTKGLINSYEFVRTIIQSLESLGYNKSAACLELESGVSLKSKEFETLESGVLCGDWDKCIECVVRIRNLSDEGRALALFRVLKQCLLECLDRGDDRLALGVLHKWIAGLHLPKDIVQQLACSLISRNIKFECDGVDEQRKRLLEELEAVLPPPLTLPERRLEKLIEMAVTGQIDNCLYHSSPYLLTLYKDHHCEREQFPKETIQILTDHKNEVWFVQFSNNGKYLASSSSDCTAIIWKVMDNDQMAHKHTLQSHKKPVSFVAWSPDDTMLMTCGNVEVLKLWDVEAGTCKHTFVKEDFPVSSCAWFPDSKRLVCGSSKPGKGIYMWDCDGNEIKAWKGGRMPTVLDLSVTHDGAHLISIMSGNEIRILNVGTNAERVISEEHSITSLSISWDSKFLIVNLNSQEIHMWDIAGNWLKPMQYRGHKQHKYVYIWNRRTSYPLEILSGHQTTVNSVSWNPCRPRMLASASDDQTIRIWGPSQCK